jgi:hypothetical protein
MIVRTTSKEPEKLADRFADGQVVDAGNSPGHETVFIGILSVSCTDPDKKRLSVTNRDEPSIVPPILPRRSDNTMSISYAFGNTCPESSSYRPVREELGAQCIPRISRLVGFFDRFISLLPGSLFKECLLDINLGGMHFVKCLGDGLHVFWRHCGFGHGPNRRPLKPARRPLSAFPDPVGNRLRSGRQKPSG